ncbi:prefoldin subunit alpha [Candidatus Heimdallarchaeota archaeon B3_Heim]|nr:MAG: prefoldin subunit alpha [Candidatus Heimdallarchaeota archaeon B3_Heim]
MRMATPNLPPGILQRVQVLQAEIEQLQLSINAIEQQISLINRAMNSVDGSILTQEELEGKKSGDDILIPIGGSNYIRCSVKDPEKVYISLGSGISRQTTIKEAISRNKEQLNSLNSNMKQLREQFNQFSQMLNIKRTELVKIAQDYQILS